MSKHTFLTTLSAAAISLFAISLAQAGEMSPRKHTAKHVSSQAWRHSYARMPIESEAPSAPISPNLFETGHPPAQPGPAH